MMRREGCMTCNKIPRLKLNWGHCDHSYASSPLGTTVLPHIFKNAFFRIVYNATKVLSYVAFVSC